MISIEDQKRPSSLGSVFQCLVHATFSLFLFTALFAEKAPLHHYIDEDGSHEVLAPWFTGPLLAPSSIVIPLGHYNIEPYIYAVANTAKYDANWHTVKMETFWNNYFQPSFQFGIAPRLDFQFNPTVYYNTTRGVSSWQWGDMPIGIDLQLYRGGGELTDWITALKLALKETLPLGKYQKLNPEKFGTDVGGQGSWQTGLGLIWGNLFYLGKGRFVATRFSFSYTLPAPVRVKNLNAYGGGPGTRGTVYPAQNFTIDLGSEWGLTQNWVFALDVVASWSGKVRFKGDTAVKNTAPASAQFSLAPAIEYNWNANLGIIFGPWFTFAGRNSERFASAIFALNYYK